MFAGRSGALVVNAVLAADALVILVILVVVVGIVGAERGGECGGIEEIMR